MNKHTTVVTFEAFRKELSDIEAGKPFTAPLHEPDHKKPRGTPILGILNDKSRQLFSLRYRLADACAAEKAAVLFGKRGGYIAKELAPGVNLTSLPVEAFSGIQRLHNLYEAVDLLFWSDLLTQIEQTAVPGTYRVLRGWRVIRLSKKSVVQV